MNAPILTTRLIFTTMGKTFGRIVLAAAALGFPGLALAAEASGIALGLLDAEISADLGSGKPTDAAAREQAINAFIAQIGSANPTAALLRPNPGEDLRAICHSARDGQVIELAPGNYPGTIQVDHKRLVVRGASAAKTVLTGGPEIAVVVGEGGVLVLEDLAVHPVTPIAAGLVVQKGAVLAHHCAFANFTEQGCNVDAGQSVLAGCTFHHAGKVAIAGSGTIFICESRFDDGDNGVAMQGGPGLGLVACHFDNFRVVAQCQDCAQLALRGNTATVTPARRAASSALQLAGGTRIYVGENHLIGFEQAIAVTGNLPSPAIIARNQIINPGSGLYLSAASPSGQPAALVTDNLVGNSEKFALFATKGVQAQLERNVLIARAGPAVALQDSGKITLDHNDLYSAEEALALRGSAAAGLSLQGDRIAGPLTPGMSGYAQDEASRRFSAAFNAPQAATAFGAVAAAVTDSLAKANGDDDSLIKSALAIFSRALASLDAIGADNASVTLHLIDRVGQTAFEPFDVFTDNSGKAGEKIARGTAAEPWATLPAGTVWLLPGSFPALAQKVELAKGQKLEATATVPNGLVLHFRENEKSAAEAILIAFKPEDRRRRMLSHFQDADRLAFTPALPRFGASTKVIAAALTLARSGIVTYSDLSAAKEKPTPEINQKLTNFSAARQYAERILALYGEAKDVELLERTSAGFTGYPLGARAATIGYVEARLGKLGDGRLAAWLRGDDPERAMMAAIVLRHYGIRAGKKVLTDYLGHLPVPAPYADLAVVALYDDASDVVLATMRLVLTQAVAAGAFRFPPNNAFNSNVGYDAALYLLAYGNGEDWKRLSALEFGHRAARTLAYAAADPTALGDFLIRNKEYYDLKIMSPALRDLPGRTEAIAVDLENRAHDYTYASYASPLAEERAEADRPRHNLRIAMTFWRPHLDPAQLLYPASRWDLEPDHAPWRVTWDIVQNLWLGWPYVAKSTVDSYVRTGRWAQLDYFPVEEIVQRFRALPEEKKIFAQDLFLQAYLVSTRENFTTIDSFHDGLERRPYLLRQQNKGALSGVLLVLPVMIGETLKLNLSIDQKVFYVKENMYDDVTAEQLAIHHYAINGGHGLITGVRIWKGEKTFAVTEKPAAGALFSYTANLGQSDFSGVYADVTFSFFDQTRHLVFDLFASDAAQAQRRTISAEKIP